jgi:hypothetical protein
MRFLLNFGRGVYRGCENFVGRVPLLVFYCIFTDKFCKKFWRDGYSFIHPSLSPLTPLCASMSVSVSIYLSVFSLSLSLSLSLCSISLSISLFIFLSLSVLYLSVFPFSLCSLSVLYLSLCLSFIISHPPPPLSASMSVSLSIYLSVFPFSLCSISLSLTPQNID